MQKKNKLSNKKCILNTNNNLAFVFIPLYLQGWGLYVKYIRLSAFCRSHVPTLQIVLLSNIITRAATCKT